MKWKAHDIKELNLQFGESTPEEIIRWAVEAATRPVITTNFRPYEVVLLKAVTDVHPRIPVIWCDTGYNTRYTYQHAEFLIQNLELQVQLYVPRQTAAYRDVLMGVPSLDDPRHQEFTEQVKLEPFRRAMQEHAPDCWFTNLRKGQTAHRDSLDIFSVAADGKLKVSPFYHWDDTRLDAWLEERGLPNEHRYYDPTKVLANRECGLHN